MEEIAEVKTNVVKLRTGKESKKKQRATLHSLLSSDDEYQNMHEHIIIDETMEQTLDSEIKAETQLASVSNIMKLVYLDVQGYSAGAISEEMAMSIYDIQTIRRSAAFKNAKDAVMAEIINKSRQMIEVSTIKAVKTLTECMESRNDKVRLSAAVEVLNRTGLTATQKIELTTTQNTMVNFTDDELEEILRSNNAFPATAEVISDGSK